MTQFLLKGLVCANCATSIEKLVNRIEGVTNAAINIISGKLTMEIADGEDSYKIFKQVQAAVNRLEPDVLVIPEDNTRKIKKIDNAGDECEDGRKKEIFKLFIGGALFATGLLFKFPQWAELTFYITSYIILGGNVILNAIKGITRGRVFSEHFLMSVATIGAFSIGEYPEGVAVMLFYLLGEILEDLAIGHTKRSISALMDIRPDYANKKIGSEIKQVSPEDVAIGNIIIIKPGERVPLDGRVVEGTSMVDTAALTGESLPRELGPGNDALSGFINKSGVLTVEVTKGFEESTVSRILDLVQNANNKKAPTEKLITKFARFYTPAVVFGALALAVIPPLVIPGALFSDWFNRALVFLVVSCPCALVLSIPLGFIGGIGGASKKGILVKGGNYLEALNHVEAVVFDKTGTLTKGVFEVTEITPQNGYSAKELLEYAAYAESYSTHPIALSIINAYHTKIDKRRIQSHREITGYGIKVTVDGKEVLVGNARLMADENITHNHVETIGTAVLVAIDKKFAGSINISDEVKEDSARAITALKSLGIRKIIMLSGDVKAAADIIGHKLGIDEIYSELLPADKVEKIEYLATQKTRKGKIVFVGDGINDAPVLARADIGMAMGGLGSDAAIEAADVVIMTDEPSKIASAIKIAKRTRTIVTQNIAFALAVKAIFLLLGAAGMASMWEAVFADMGVTILAVLNAMRAMNMKDI